MDIPRYPLPSEPTAPEMLWPTQRQFVAAELGRAIAVGFVAFFGFGVAMALTGGTAGTLVTWALRGGTF